MTLALAAKVQFGNSPQVKLTATSTTSAPNAVPNNTLLTIVRTHADGSRHNVLTESAPRLVGGGWVWLDVHCPFNQAVTYTITAAGASATTAPVWLLSKRTWLLHPTRADLSVMVEKVSIIAGRSRSSRASEFTPQNGGKSLFLSGGPREGVKGSISFRVSKANEHLYDELIDADSVVLINTPGTAGWDVGWMWVQPGEVTYDNKAAGLVKYPYREITFPFKESVDPDDVFEPEWSSADVLAYWSALGVTSGGLVAKYATSLDLVTDTRV